MPDANQIIKGPADAGLFIAVILSMRPVFPLSPATYTGFARALPADSALDWLQCGWWVFRLAPRRWLLLAIFLVALLALPVLFSWRAIWLSLLAWPFLAAGWLDICQRALAEAADTEEGETSFAAGSLLGAMSALFVPLKTPALWLPALLGTGGVFIVCHLPGLTLRLSAAAGIAPPFLPFFLTILMAPLMLLPLGMALVFTPCLLYPQRLSVGLAMRASFVAACKNMLPLGFFVFLLSLLAFAAILSVGLLLPLCIPVVFAAWRAACQDIFNDL